MAEVSSFFHAFSRLIILRKLKPYAHTPNELNRIKKYNNLSIFHFANKINADFKSNRINGVIFGNFGAKNYGDEAILAGQLEELRNVKNLSQVIISRFPKQIRKVHKTKGVGMLDARGVIKHIFSADFLIVGGGGLFCKNDGGIVGFLFQLYTLLIFLSLPILLRKKIYVLGIGFYTNTNIIISLLARVLLKYVEVITVRDFHSFTYLTTKGNAVGLYKDNSYLMELDSVFNVKRNIYFKNNYTEKRYNIGIAVKKPETAYETDHLLSELQKFIVTNWKDTDYWIYPLDNHAGYTDYQFAQDIVAKVRHNKQVRYHIMPINWHPKTLFTSFKLMDFFIGLRFHSLVYAYRYNIPIYGMTYDEKCTSFLRSIGEKPILIKNASSLIMQHRFEKMKKSLRK